MNDKIVRPILIGKRPTYHHGQLLEEDDFRDEQAYHIDARQQHNRHMHGWGVVHGLEIRKIDERKVEAGPGYAIDREGRELFLEKNEHLDLTGFDSDRIEICLYYDENNEPDSEGSKNRILCRVCLAAVSSREELPPEKLLLGVVRLVGGKVDKIDYSLTDYSHKHRRFTDWIFPQDLSPQLRIGWMTLPFHPTNLDRPLGEKKTIPQSMHNTKPDEFDVGFTEASSAENGAGGNMAFPLPPGASSIKRFRIAGRVNEGGISVLLVVAGWDSIESKHIFEERLSLTIKPDAESHDRGAYNIIEKIEKQNIDPENNTLVLQVLATGRAKISLIGVEMESWVK